MPGEQTFLLAGIFLLLTAGGWAIRYLWEKDKPKEPHQYLNVEYLKGLNFLLNEQTDQAVDLFLRMVRVDDETIETHFALGSLFRRRGEVDRAIRIHQNIIARPNLPEEQRDQALHSLAKDYLRAGLLDRAENLFVRLLERPNYREDALDFLSRIYEQERDWAKAIDVGRQLESIRGKQMSLTVAHYYCELAQKSVEESDYVAARQNLREAQAGRLRTIRGTLARAELAELTDDEKTAKKLYWRVIDENSDLIVEVLPRLYAMHAKSGQLAKLEDLLSALLKKKPEIGEVVAYTAIVNAELESPIFDRCIREYILSEPTLGEFVALDVLNEASENGAETIQRIKKGLQKLSQKTPKYRCSECGFSGMNLLWQCPSCKQWETQRPANQVRFDSLVRGNSIDW